MALVKKELSEEQQIIFDKITKEKKNIFFTGCGGTGKSFLVKEIIQYFQATIGSQHLAITASTGRAGFNIGGITLHSFTGVGLGKEGIATLVSKATFNKRVCNRWKSTQVLIIDEISMLDADYFSKVNEIAKAIRKSSAPFGGIQLVLTGDLLQLPPVSEGINHKKRIFQADCWNECIQEYGVLHEVFRQEDIRFAEILTYIRLGEVTADVEEFIETLTEEKKYDSESGPVNLYSTRANADKHNKEQLDAINSETKIYKAIDTYRSKANASSLDNCPAVAALELKVGAQVMLVKNINKDLVNGTVGTLIGFTEEVDNSNQQTTLSTLEQLPIVRFDLADGKLFTRAVKREVWSQQLPGGEEIASRAQIPLILAWAVTIHKSQGQTIQRLKVDLSDVFESGQIYTALSRAVSPDTLQVIGFDSTKVLVDQESLRFVIENNLI